MSHFEFDSGDTSENADEENIEWGGVAATVFLVDCSSQMFEEKDENNAETLFSLATRCAYTTLTRKIISSSKDLTAFILFNTKKTKNDTDFQNIYILQNLERPGAERILELEVLAKLNDKQFESKYGVSSSASIADVLWICSSIFSSWKSRLVDQTVLLFTCNDTPHLDDSQRTVQALRKAKDLQEAGISLEIIPLGTKFGMEKFYKDIIGNDEDSSALEVLADPSVRFEELLDKVRRVEHRHRTVGRTSFTLTEGVKFGVSFYTSVRKMTKPTKSKLYKITNEEVKTLRNQYLEDTGELVMPSDIDKFQIYGGRKIKFSLEEVKSLTSVYEDGVQLLGFKPVFSIKPYLHIRSPSFMCPDEKAFQGSKKLFTALLTCCSARQVCPIVRVVVRKGSKVAWAALLPQEEERDERNAQIKPPGFHVCYLPFADDFRNIEIMPLPRAPPQHVETAKAIMKKLHFRYNPEQFDNPALQTHWRNIEALALNRDTLEPVTDYTMPDHRSMDKKAGALIGQFCSLIFPPDYDPFTVAKKRPTATNAAAPKRPKLDCSSLSVEEMAKNNMIHKLTVDDLKNWLKERGVRVTGKKKDQLVQDVYDKINT